MIHALKTGLLTILVCMIAHPAFAREITEQEIRNYLDEIVTLYTGEEMNSDKIVAFMDKYVSEDAHFRMKVSHGEDGVVVKEVEFDYKQVRQATKEHFGRMFQSSARYQIDNLEFSEDKTNVVVDYKFWHNAGVTTYDQNRKANAQVQMQALSECRETFGLKEEHLKLLDSYCAQNVSITDPIYVE